MIKILHNLALFWVKNANIIAEFFGENILKSQHRSLVTLPTNEKSSDDNLFSSAFL
jgi:hypothetical protein